MFSYKHQASPAQAGTEIMLLCRERERERCHQGGEVWSSRQARHCSMGLGSDQEGNRIITITITITLGSSRLKMRISQIMSFYH